MKKIKNILLFLLSFVLLVASSADAITVGDLKAVTPGVRVEGTASPYTLYYVPTADASINFTMDAAPAAGNVSSTAKLDWISDPQVQYTAGEGNYTVFEDQSLTFKQTGTDANSLSLDVTPSKAVTLNAKIVSNFNEDTDVMLNIRPEKTGFAVQSGTAGVGFLRASDTTYNCVVPLSTASLTVKAVLSGTLSTDISWEGIRTSGTSVTVTPAAIAAETLVYGYSGTKEQTFNFAAPVEGDVARVSVNLSSYAAGDISGNVSARTIELFVTFSDVQAATQPFNMSASTVTTYYNSPYTRDVTVTPLNSSDVVTVTSVEPATWNGLSLAVKNGSTIGISGTPASLTAGSQEFTVTATLNGVPQTSKFKIEVKDPSELPIKMNPTYIEAFYGTSLDQSIALTTNGGALSGVSVDPVSWNSITVTPNTNSVRFSGTPSNKSLTSQMFTIGAYVDGVWETVTLPVSVASPYLDPEVSNVSFDVDSSANGSVFLAIKPSGASVSNVSVSPTLWNGITASTVTSATGVTVYLSGKPEKTGSQIYVVKATVNGEVVERSFTVTTSVPNTNGYGLVSTRGSDWDGDISESRNFTMSTVLYLPSNYSFEDISNVTATFLNQSVILSGGPTCTWSLNSSGRTMLNIAGTLNIAYDTEALVLKTVQVTFRDATTSVQDNIGLSLASVLDRHSGGGGGCDMGLGAAAFAAVLLLLVKRR